MEPFDWADDCPELAGTDWATYLVAGMVAVVAGALVSLVAWLTVTAL